MHRTVRIILSGILFFLAVLAWPSGLHAQNDAAKIYKTNCVLCHAADGSGNTPSGKALGAKDLGSTEVQKKSDEELAKIIASGQGKMPAFGAKVKGDGIKELVAYIRSLAKK